MKTIEYRLTPEDLQWMQITRRTVGLLVRVMRDARSSLPSGGAELDPALPLFEEATRALMSRCPTSAAVVSRGCLEATLRAALIRMSWGDSGAPPRRPIVRSRRASSPGLEALIDEAKSRGLLSASLHTSARRIKEDGDFGAHLAERWDTQVRYSADVTAPTDGLPRWKPIRLWVTGPRALSNLRALAKIIRVVSRRASAAEATRLGTVHQ